MVVPGPETISQSRPGSVVDPLPDRFCKVVVAEALLSILWNIAVAHLWHFCGSPTTAQ